MPSIVYPGTFDPITFGHLDLITRAVPLFDRLIVAVAASSSKTPLFSLDERVRLAREVTAGFENVEVIGFNELTTSLLDRLETNVLLRGLRTGTDFDYEWQLAQINQLQRPGTESLFMTPAAEYSSISSSIVREIARFGGNVSRLVPAPVVTALLARLGQEQH